MPKLRCYLAGPGFNPVQLGLIRRLEKTIEEAGVIVWSPFRDQPPLNIKDPNDRRRVFQNNHQEVDNADLVVAVVDGSSLQSLADAGGMPHLTHWMDGEIDSGKAAQEYPEVKQIWERMKRLVARDDGTVWEIGYAYAQGKLIVTYTDFSYGLNLMLSECVVAHAKGMEALKEILRRLTSIDPNVPSEHTASVIASLQSEFPGAFYEPVQVTA